nr:U3 small nucleolar RNA-associated protein 25 [Tanacetum cinerariifolium]GEZ18186.1 U3 small nucleolar RNA-associated protein 25 [Tanacetum cinerariifolium]
NWSHVNTVVEQLNRIPSKQHGTDIMRIRPWYLDGQARFYRQTIILGSHVNPVAKFQRNPIKPHASTQQLPKASHDRPTFNTNNLPPKRSYAFVTHAESRKNLSQQSKLDNIKSIQLNDDDLILVEDSSTVVMIKVLSPSFVVDERVTWIEVSGLPLYAACIITKIQSLISEKVNVTIKDSNFNVHVKEIGTWSTPISNDMDSNESDDDHDMEEHRSINEDVDPNAALVDFIQQNIVKERALKDSKEGDQANVSTHVAGNNETLFSKKVKEEYFVTNEDKPSEEDVSDTSKPPGFENFIKENSECLISSYASRSVGGTLGYDVKGCKKSLRKMINGIGPHGWCSGLVDSGVGTIGDHCLGNECSGLVLDFQNSEACFLSAKWATSVSFSGSDFGRYRAMLDFENSVIHLSSTEKDLRKLVKLNNEGWFCSNVVNGFLRDDRYECLFRQSRSVETQGESSSMNFRRKSGFTEYSSSSQEDVGDRNVGYTDFPHEDCMSPSHGKTTRNTRSRGIRIEAAHEPVPVTPISAELYLQPTGPANPASTKLTKNQKRKTPETLTEAINKPLKRTLFPDESMEHKKQRNPIPSTC